MTGLETILQQHEEGMGWQEDADDNLIYDCDCGDTSPPLAKSGQGIDETAVEAAANWHRAHVADQIRGWLLSDHVIDAIAEAIFQGERDRTYGQTARAAITAALDTTEDS